MAGPYDSLLNQAEPSYGGVLNQQQPSYAGVLDQQAQMLNQSASGQPIDPKVIAASDQQAATLLDEGMKGLRRFGYSTIATGQAFAGTALAPFFPKIGNDLISEGLRTIKMEPQEDQPAVQNWSDVHDLRSGALKFAGAVGEGLPSSLMAVAGGLGGRALGVGAARLAGLRGAAAEAAATRASWLGGAATMIPGEGGETALDLAKDPVAMANTTPWQRAGLVGGRGTINALLEEAVPQALVIPHLLGKAARIRPGLGAGLRNIGLLAGEGAVGEYGTEFAQDLTGQYAQNVAHPGTGYNFQQAHEAGLSGAASGIFLGGAGGAAQAVHSNLAPVTDLVGRGVDKVRGALPKPPTLDDLVGGLKSASEDPAGTGAALARGTMEGIAKAAEAAGVIRQYGVKGIDTAEDYLSKTYDSVAKFVAKNVKDPELKDWAAGQMADFKTMTAPEWDIFKRELSTKSGKEFVEDLGMSATMLGRKALGAAEKAGSWISDAATGYYDTLTKGAEGTTAHMSLPSAAQRTDVMERLYAVAPGIKDAVEAAAPSINDKTRLASMLHFAMNDAQFLQGAEHDPGRAKVLQDWQEHTGTDLLKVLDAMRGRKNVETFREVAAPSARKALEQVGINPEHASSLMLIAQGAAEYSDLSASQQRLLVHLAGSEKQAQVAFASLHSVADKQMREAELKTGAGEVGSQLGQLGDTPGMVTGAAKTSDEGGFAGTTNRHYDESGRPLDEATETRSPFDQDVLKHALAVERHATNADTTLPITLRPTNANVNSRVLANALGGRRVGGKVGDKFTNDIWKDYAKGMAPTNAERTHLLMNINPMSLANLVSSKQFRDQFAPHIAALDERPGQSFDQIKGQRFISALSELNSQGLHVDPEALGLPADHPLVHVEAHVDLSKLKDSTLIHQEAGGKNKLTWGDVVGTKRLQKTQRRQLARLKQFRGKFEGSYAELRASENALDQHLANVAYARTKNAPAPKKGEKLAPLAERLDAAVAQYRQDLPNIIKAQRAMQRAYDYASAAREAYQNGDITPAQMDLLAAYYRGKSKEEIEQEQAHEQETGKKTEGGIKLQDVIDASRAFGETALNLPTKARDKLTELLERDKTAVDQGRTAFEDTQTGAGMNVRSTQADIEEDWTAHRYSPQQKAQQERSQGIQSLVEKGKVGVTKQGEIKRKYGEGTVTPQTKVTQAPADMTGAELKAQQKEAAAKQAEKEARAAEAAQEQKEVEAEKAKAELHPDTKTVTDKLTQQLEDKRKAMAFAAKGNPTLLARINAQIDKLIEYVKSKAESISKELQSSSIGQVLTKYRNDITERLQRKDESREGGVGMSPERYTAIRAAPTQAAVTFTTKSTKKGRALTHGELNSIVQGWQQKYLPNTKIDLKIYAREEGDSGGFVDSKPGNNTIHVADSHVNPLALYGVLSHEFGHLMQYNHFNAATNQVKQQLMQAYNDDVKMLQQRPITKFEVIQRFGNAADAVIRGSEVLHHQLSELDSASAEQQEYRTSFREWFANQFSKTVMQGLNTNDSPEVQGFWKSLLKKVKDFYNDVVTKIAPNVAFEKWVKSLEQPQRDQQGAPLPPAGGNITPPTSAAQKRFLDIVHSMMGDKKIQVLFDQKLQAGVTGSFETRAELLNRIRTRRTQVVEALREARKDGNEKQIDKLTKQVEALNKHENSVMLDNAVQGYIYVAKGTEEKAGLAEHETFHAAFKTFFDANERRILGQTFSRGLTGKRMREIFKDDPIVLERMAKDAEEAAAYAFQVWAANPELLQLGAQTETMFQRLLNFVRKIFGSMTPEEKAELIFNNLRTGRRLETAVSPVARVLDKDASWQQRAQNMAGNVGGLLKQGFDILFTPAYERMIGTNNPALSKIADLVYQATGEEGNTGGMIQRGRFQYKRQINKLTSIFRDLSEQELKDLHTAMVFDKPPTDAKLTPRFDALKAWYKDMYSYQTDAGVRLNDAGVVQGYYPLTWDPEKVLKNKKAFIDMLEQNYAKELLTTKKTPNEIYESITGYLDRGEDLVNVMGKDKEPLSESVKSRTLAFISREHRVPFMAEDPVHTAFRYAKQAVRQAEYVRSFGMKSSKLEALMNEAEQKYGATAEDRALANDFIDGAMGNKEIGMSRELKDLYGAMNVYQNYRLLPFSLFSSLIDPLGVAVRSNSATDAWDTFAYSIKNLFKEWKKDYPRDFYEKYAEDWGIIEHSGTSENANNLYDGATLRGATKELNDKLFKYNLLSGWVRNNTIMAVKAAQRSFYRAAEGDMGKHSERYLEELGLEKSDVHYDAAQKRILVHANELEAAGLSKDEAKRVEEKLANATEKFVRQSLLNPSAAELPNWASNPYLAPIAHLKQFVFSFNMTIMNRITHELKHGNFKPVGLAAAYVPSMIAADFMKDMIAGFGEEPPYKKDWGVVDYINNGMNRSGLTGTGQFFSGASEDIVRGGGGWESWSGPMAQQIQQGVKAFGTGDSGAIKNWMIKALPLQAAFRHALPISPEHTGKQSGPSGGASGVLGLADDVAFAIAR
jgi:hypothetical protein